MNQIVNKKKRTQVIPWSLAGDGRRQKKKDSAASQKDPLFCKSDFSEQIKIANFRLYDR